MEPPCGKSISCNINHQPLWEKWSFITVFRMMMHDITFKLWKSSSDIRHVFNDVFFCRIYLIFNILYGRIKSSYWKYTLYFVHCIHFARALLLRYRFNWHLIMEIGPLFSALFSDSETYFGYNEYSNASDLYMYESACKILSTTYHFVMSMIWTVFKWPTIEISN